MDNDNMSSVNNTESLDDNPGVGVRNYSSYTSQMIDVERSRANYRKANSAKLDKLREAVYKTVRTWPEEDKYRIISEHGDSDLLKQNPHGEKLNQLCTETLIIHLPMSDLNQILADVKISERQLAAQIKQIEKEKKRDAAKIAAQTRKTSAVFSSDAPGAFNAGSFNSYASKMNSNDTNKTLLAKIAKLDPTFRIPASISHQFTRLRKELSEVLDECFNKLELSRIGSNMGLDLSSGEDALKKSIINKTILYVALITGKSKTDNLGNAIMDPAPYNELLHFTSYSYATGEPGLDPAAWQTLKKEARIAKRRIEVMSKMQKARASRTSSAFLALSGGNKNAREIARNDKGALANLSPEQIIGLAGQYGIDPKKYSIGKLKLEIYRAMAANNRATAALDNKAAIAKKKGRYASQGILDEISIRKELLNNGENIGAGSSSGGGAVPTISFDAKGNRIDAFIPKAVPVYLVGSVTGGAGGNIAPEALDRQGTLSTWNVHASKGNYRDTAKNRRNSLNVSDRMMLNQIMGLDMTTRFDFIKENIKPNTNGRILAYIEGSFTGTSADDEYDKNAVYAWLFAVVNHRQELQKYIETNIYNGKPPFDRKDTVPDVGTRIKNFGKRINPLKGAFSAVKAVRNFGKRIAAIGTLRASGYTNIEALPTKEQDFYYSELQRAKSNPDAYCFELSKYYLLTNKFTIKDSQVAATYTNIRYQIQQYIDGGTISLSASEITDMACNIAVMLYARLKGFSGVVKYIEATKLYGLFKEKDFKKKKGFMGSKAIGSGVRRLKHVGMSLFGGVGKSKFVNADNESNGAYSGNGATGAKGRFTAAGNPIIGITANGIDGTITDAIPVYNVNNPSEIAISGDTLLKIATIINSVSNTMNNTMNTLDLKTMNLISNASTTINNGSKVSSKQMAGSVKAGVKTLFRVPKTKKRRAPGDKTGEPGKYNTTLVDAFSKVSKIVDKTMKENTGISTKSPLFKVVVPTVIVNKDLENISTGTDNILKGITTINESLSTSNTILNGLLTGFSMPAALAGAPTMTGTLTFPGMITAQATATVKKNLKDIETATADMKNILGKTSNIYNHTGARISKLATGGTVSIAGDAASSNIFANGAKPELIQSSGDMTVTPLNKAGSSTKQRVEKMTLNERSSALATSIASHVVRVSYKLPDGSEDVSNSGEAIKVYNVKPGIDDDIDLGNGNSASLISLVASIYAQLTTMTAQDQTNGQLLTTIAANTAAGNNNSNSSSIQSNPFAGGFPTSLDDILSGE